MTHSNANTSGLTPTDALRLVPLEPTSKMIRAMCIAIEDRELLDESDPNYVDGYDALIPLARYAWQDALKAAPASPLPGGGWQDISTFRESGQGNPVIVAVPTKEGGWIVGEAWKSLMDADDPYRGNDGWWWAGTSPGDAYNDPIRFMNHGDAEWWMPLPAAPTGDA